MPVDQPQKCCRWCGEAKPLIKAHIIPRTFYEVIRGDSPHSLVISPNDQKYTKASQSGIWDSNILCADCDGKLGILDELGYKTFGGPPPDSATFFDSEGMPVGFRLPCPDIEQVHRFILSILWRASVSTDPFFKTVALGTHYEEEIKEALKSAAPLNYTQWEFVAIRLIDNKYERGILPIIKSRFDQVWYYNLYVPYFKFMVKMDKRPAPPILRVGRFSADNGSVCLRMSFEDSPESVYLGKFAAALRERESRRR